MGVATQIEIRKQSLVSDNRSNVRTNHLTRNKRIAIERKNELSQIQNFVLDVTDLSLKEFTVFNSRNINDLTKFDGQVHNILNHSKINDLRYINKYFERVNEILPNNGHYVCCVEVYKQRIEKIDSFSIPVLGMILSFLYFLLHRVMPKINFLNKLYYALSKGRNRCLTKSETLGRLASCGFQIVKFKEIEGLLFIVVKKTTAPSFNMNPSYGPIFSMPRVGKDKKIINVYKIRTMHPYSEYLQTFMFENYGSENGDKINEDFRVSKFGKILRRFWIDEIPMIFNLIKGDIKLVGVRPLSVAKFEMYPKDLQDKRVVSKPGLIPPFYYDLPNSFEGLIRSEESYLKSYAHSPFKTDLKYFFGALYNIIIKGSRSK